MWINKIIQLPKLTNSFSTYFLEVLLQVVSWSTSFCSEDRTTSFFCSTDCHEWISFGLFNKLLKLDLEYYIILLQHWSFTCSFSFYSPLKSRVSSGNNSDYNIENQIQTREHRRSTTCFVLYTLKILIRCSSGEFSGWWFSCRMITFSLKYGQEDNI